MITVMVAASGSARGSSGDHPESTPSPTDTVKAAVIPESQPRQFKGMLDSIGPFSWLDLDGRQWTDRDFRGKTLIVQQWAAWCQPCIDEFPEIQKLFDGVKNDRSVAFVSLDMDRDPAKIQEFLHEFRKEYSFPVLFAGADLKILSLPRTWIVDREGFIRESFRNVDQALALVDAVRHRPPVSTLPPETVQEKRKQNERDGATSR